MNLKLICDLLANHFLYLEEKLAKTKDGAKRDMLVKNYMDCKDQLTEIRKLLEYE